MLIDELTQVINESNLLPYEVAEAVYEYLQPFVVAKAEFGCLKDIERDSDLIAFYLAAKHLKDI